MSLPPPSFPRPFPGLCLSQVRVPALLLIPPCHSAFPSVEIQRLQLLRDWKGEGECSLRSPKQRISFPLLGSGQWSADVSSQPGACCPSNSPAPPLLIGCLFCGNQPGFKGTPATALWKTQQSHCDWGNKWSFSCSPCLVLAGCVCWGKEVVLLAGGPQSVPPT